jgi:hypothetical protein
MRRKKMTTEIKENLVPLAISIPRFSKYQTKDGKLLLKYLKKNLFLPKDMEEELLEAMVTACLKSPFNYWYVGVISIKKLEKLKKANDTKNIYITSGSSYMLRESINTQEGLRETYVRFYSHI